MTQNRQLDHIAVLAEIDGLVSRLNRWVDSSPDWEPAHRCRALIRRLMNRVENLRFRLESPLVVATFGGTGTGKSSLVNALIGDEVTAAGRQRPTTKTPILLVHPDLEVDALGLDTDQFVVKRIDAPVLKDIVVVDCPDPDTSESATAGSNLALLREIAPHCDVLIYTSTQQKYRNARVIDELGDIASGCRLVFVQTHADRDSDIRDDWRTRLSPGYEVPDMFFVDSPRALGEQREGKQPSGDFGRLLQLLTNQLGASRRLEIRRANLVDLLQEALNRCRLEYDDGLPKVRSLQSELEQQRSRLKTTLTSQLCDELLVNQNLWERRLIGAVTDRWGFSPFSSALRLYNGLGAFIASFTLFRARTSAQMALIGAVQGARWMKSRAKEQEADSSLERLSTFGISDQLLQESRMVISGYVRSAEIDRDETEDHRDLADLRRQAASLEGEFLGDARRSVDELIEDLAAKNCGWLIRAWYETLLLLYVVFLLVRVGYNFFWASFLGPILGFQESQAELLKVDFYIPAVLFLVIWSAVLVTAFTWRLRRGLTRRVREFAQTMADSRLAHGLFPSLEATCSRIETDSDRVTALLEQTTAFRHNLATSNAGFLGGRRSDA
ncbi:MAG: GTPase domain-containing protein [Planctomycetaceae bacterium]